MTLLGSLKYTAQYESDFDVEDFTLIPESYTGAIRLRNND